MNAKSIDFLSALVVFAAVGPAQAQRSRQTTVVGSQERVLTREFNAECIEGVCSRQQRTTGPQGQTSTRNSARFVDENGDYVKQTDATGPNGETAARTVVRDGAGAKTTTRTGVDGEPATRTRQTEVPD